MKTVNRLAFLLVLVALLSGCDLLKKDKTAGKTKKIAESDIEKVAEKGEVLLRINGKPVLNEVDFLTSIRQMLQANPYFKGASIDMLPVAIKRKFLDELIKQELILAWADKNKIINDPEFLKSKKEVLKLVERSLQLQQFEKKVLKDINITDKDIEREFNKNKEKYVKVAGGVLVSAVKFKDDKADAFYDKVKNEKTYEDFIKLAKKEDGFEDFGRVSVATQPGMNTIPRLIKDKALSLKDLPAIEKIKVGKSLYVVYVSDKKEDIYFELNEIKPQIEMMLKNNSFKTKLDKELIDLRKQFSIDVNEDYFKKLEQQQPQAKEPAANTDSKKTSAVAA